MTLTINIDEKKLNALRKKAESKGSSLEELFEKYLDSFLEEENMQPTVSDNIRDRPEFRGKSSLEIIKELTKDINLSADFDEREDYREHIIRKHA